MARLQLKPSIVKRLFALSGNQCAYQNCTENLIDSMGTVIGEICHIEAAEPNGQRYNSISNDEYRRSFENLILLCGKHHKITNNVNEYPTSKLIELKSVHEKSFLNKEYNTSDKVVQQAIENYMKQANQNTGSGTQINNQTKTIIGVQIDTQYIHYTADKKTNLNIDGARKVNDNFKKIIEGFTQKASPPSTEVIDFRNELTERTERPVEIRPTKDLRFRKDNGRIKADVESYEKENNVLINEENDNDQNLLRKFLLGNDREKNDELKRLLVQKGQQRPAIITCDGFLINGNRRKMALEELYNEKNQESRFEMMRVVILPEGVTELDIQKIENRYQLQSEGKSEYQGLNRALTLQRNIEKGFPLEAQLKDDPNYHDLPRNEFAKVVEEYKKKYLRPLECVDRYLKTFNKEGYYNTISESANDKDGRWQAFVDYSNFYSSTLKNPKKLVEELKMKESEVGKTENAIFKIIRKRSLNSELESNIGKLHELIRKAPKYLKIAESKKLIFKIAEDVKEDIPDEMKYDKGGIKISERDIDEKWGQHFRKEILGNLIQAHKIVSNQQERDKPLELLEDALKKLKHDNLKIENMDVTYYPKAMELTKQIVSESDSIYAAIDSARFKLKKISTKGK